MQPFFFIQMAEVRWVELQEASSGVEFMILPDSVEIVIFLGFRFGQIPENSKHLLFAEKRSYQRPAR